MKERRLQTVTIHFDEGRIATFAGPVVIEDENDKPRVKQLVFSRPMPLADGVHFGTLEGIIKKDPT